MVCKKCGLKTDDLSVCFRGICLTCVVTAQASRPWWRGKIQTHAAAHKAVREYIPRPQEE